MNEIYEACDGVLIKIEQIFATFLNYLICEGIEVEIRQFWCF